MATVFNTNLKHSVFTHLSVGNAKGKLPENRSLDIDSSQLLENIASVFCFNASAVSCFDITFVVSPFQLNVWFVRYKFWKRGRTFRGSNSADSCIQSDQANVVSGIHFSLIKCSTDQNETAVSFWGSSIQYYFRLPNFNTRIVLRMQSENSRKLLFGLWLFIASGKHYLLEKISSQFFFFVLEADWETFPRPLPILLYFVVNTLSWIQWKFDEKLKSFRKTGIDFDGIAP